MRTNYGYFEEDHLGKPYDLRLAKRLFGYIRPHGRLLMLSIVLTMAITALDLTLPYLTKVAIDRYIVHDVSDNASRTVDGPRISHKDLSCLKKSDLTVLRSKDYAGMTWIAMIFLGIIVCHFVFSFGDVIIMEYIGQSIIHDLRRDLFAHLLRRCVAFFTANPVGRLVTRVTNDIQNLHELLTSIITVLFKDIFLLAGIAILLLVIHWRLALICFAMLPIVFLTTWYFSRLARDVFRDLRIRIAEINTRLHETIAGIRVIQLFCGETRNYEGFRRLNHKNYLAEMRQINIFAVFMPVIDLLSSTGTALVIWYGGAHVLADDMSLGALVAFISYMRMFFRPIRDIAEKYNIMQSAMASSERIFLLFDNRDEIPDPERPVALETARGAISFDRVCFSYAGGTGERVLTDITFSVRPGQTVGIVGQTGAGKSSLIHLLERFYDPTEGRISIHGIDIRRIPKAVLRSRMALISQDVFLFADTLRNNILGGNKDISEERLKQIIAAANIGRLIKALPEGLDSELTEGGRILSVGERQLIAFARALAHDPEILILDEATSSIDTETERLIQEAASNLMQGRTAIVVAHRLSTIRHADRIIVLHRGRIREAGTHDKLMARQGIYYQLYQRQGI
jgi:ATP-binding cassette subfamily B protein